MPTADNALYALAIGAQATFTGDWLRYARAPNKRGTARYLEGYRGRLQAYLATPGFPQWVTPALPGAKTNGVHP